MQIYIQGITEPYKRAVEVLIQLFYEDSVIIYDDLNDRNPGTICLSFQFEEVRNEQKDSLFLKAFVTLKKSEQERIYRRNYAKDFSFSEITSQQDLQEQGGSSEYSSKEDGSREMSLKEYYRAYKHVINHALLGVLEDFTGVKQPWGILTGIRPTKLLHQKLYAGTTKEEAHQELRNEYQIAPEKVQLMQRIVDRQLAVVPDLHELQNEVSIYIGIPFCPTKCAYCTFPAYDIKGQQGSVGTFLEGLHSELMQVGNWLKENNIGITTIYFGGGTPTSIEAEQMDALYEQMYRYFPAMDRVREVTVEAGRPDTITPEKINVLKKHSIDRISINPQSYTQETLDAIGRHHTVEETIEKYELARSMGLSNINMDLIIGLPGEGLAELEHSLAQTEQLMPESLTVHTLSFKRASAMTKNKAKYKVAGRDEIIQMMELASEWTASKGYEPYYLYRQKNILGNLENVGYALPGKESIYNIMIMEEKQTIIGLGCGASSKFIHPVSGKIERFANPKEPRAYNQGYQHYTEEKLNILRQLYQDQ